MIKYKSLLSAFFLLCLGSVSSSLGQTSDAVAVAATPICPRVCGGNTYPEYAPPRVSFPGGVTGLPDVAYGAGSAGVRPLTLDLYLPPASFTGPRPFLVYIHGGGWGGGGSRSTGAYENWPGVLALFASRGYVVASVVYRLTGEAPFPAAIQDVKAAIRFLRTSADKYNIDKNRGATLGVSAGGQLSSLAAVSCGVAALEPTARANGGGRGGRGAVAANGASPGPVTAAPPATPEALESDCVQAGVMWYGFSDFTKLRVPVTPDATPWAENAYLGCGKSCTDAQLLAASPVAFVDPTDPPLLLIHGLKDTTVFAAQSQELYDVAKAKGEKAELLTFPDVGHSFVGETPEATTAASRAALARTIVFLDATIGDKRN